MNDDKASARQPEHESLVTNESEEHREVSIQGFVAAMSRRDPVAVIAEKIQPEQIDKYLDFTAKDKELGWQDREQERQDRRHQRLMTLLYVILGIVVFVVVLVLFKEVFSSNAVMLERFLIAVGGLVAGGWGGYGLGRWKKSE